MKMKKQKAQKIWSQNKNLNVKIKNIVLYIMTKIININIKITAKKQERQT